MRKNHPTPELPAALFWERTVAERLGLSRTRLRELRAKHLATETDWRFFNNAVVLTSAGLAKLELLLKRVTSTPDDAPRPADEPRGPAAVPSGPPPKHFFVVTRVPLHRLDSPQKKLVVAREVPEAFAPCSTWDLAKRLLSLDTGSFNGSRSERPVRVRDNSNFRPGMVFEAVLIGGGMWQFAGRLPRKPGKW